MTLDAGGVPMGDTVLVVATAAPATTGVPGEPRGVPVPVDMGERVLSGVRGVAGDATAGVQPEPVPGNRGAAGLPGEAKEGGDAAASGDAGVPGDTGAGEPDGLASAVAW